ncbi:uncharacterized protein BT62DRAFT_933509 [Guyanagaster necrorhizus]|uniref:Yeast cell wall synthesis Kre9/Knh1-like N-terminal domain-containing protein n=1 Tax=Guyanagaster necrorhizus TaxID=856835 RepID=A0A9P7VQZ2_9AGAR|nr:uncharacterized protein BT62DRAFT_933509 [Guyanagaster necrorhizus MCA 3950]KAG7445090.1 hypothetical protein BT62DRAFT_933509 [Guyanagaster necrorhizus MCA 3950]
MNFTLFFTAVFALLFPLSVLSAPVHVSRDVYVPAVILPNSSSVWTVGSTQTVTWDTSNPPSQITNPTGSIRLRKGNKTLSTDLISGFSILDGKVQVQVPSVEPGDDWRVVLFGDSGNWSGAFTIKN